MGNERQVELKAVLSLHSATPQCFRQDLISSKHKRYRTSSTAKLISSK